MNKARISEILKQLTAVDVPSGAERRAEELIRSLLSEQPLPGGAVAELRTDALGNLIARIPGNAAAGTGRAPGRIMLAAHMDEIGLIVTTVEAGFLHVADGRRGGSRAPSWARRSPSTRPAPARRRTRTGCPATSAAGHRICCRPDEREQVIPLGDLRVDLGSRRVSSTGGIVRVGDRVAIRGPYIELLGGRVATKALDNRASVAAMLGALGYLAGMRHTWDVYRGGDGAGGDRPAAGR